MLRENTVLINFHVTLDLKCRVSFRYQGCKATLVLPHSSLLWWMWLIKSKTSYNSYSYDIASYCIVWNNIISYIIDLHIININWSDIVSYNIGGHNEATIWHAKIFNGNVYLLWAYLTEFLFFLFNSNLYFLL